MSRDRVIEPLKLLHIVGDSRFGGAGRIILRLGEVAQAEGWQVDVLTTDPEFQGAVEKSGLGLVSVDVIRREISALRDLAGLARLSAFLGTEGYSIVHTHTSKAGFIGRLAARLARVPVIIHTVHGFAFHELSPRPTRLFYSGLERMASRWCDRIVSVSEFHHRWAIELGICRPSKILAIPNGIPLLPRPAIAPAALRHQLGLREDDRFILSTARLAPDKGLEFLIEACSIFSRIGSELRIVIAGDGPSRVDLQELAYELGVADRVMLLGFRRDISDLLEACDLVVLPSLREGLSIAFLEAMAAGKPIIATSIGSHRELASQGEVSCLVPPADAQALSKAILQLIADRERMVRLGRNARALFESRYTDERMANTYMQLYFDLLKEKHLLGKSIMSDGSNLRAISG